jgi:aminoglycoside 3-N-acetyltransferase
MRNSIITSLGIVFKRLTGINDISLLRKNIHKCIGKIIYHKKYTSDDVVNVMQKMGMTKGSVVCIHAAMKEFYNYQGSAQELIEKIMNVITPEGTLIMPAFPESRYQSDCNYIFDYKNDITKAGCLAETFRRMPNVERSINVQHSVCAWGKNAKWLIKDHNRCHNCWDENSPWYRMTRINCLVFTLGLPSWYIGTFDHCVEGVLYKEHPYWAQFFGPERIYRYYDNDGNVCQYRSHPGGVVERRTREKRLIKHFDDASFKKKKISNLKIKMFRSKECLDKMIELGRRGITMYYVPSPKKYKF